MLVAEPPGVVTLSGPVVAPAGTVAWIAVSEVTVKIGLTHFKTTVAAAVRLLSFIVNIIPTGPLVGAKLVIVGGAPTVHTVPLVAVPAEPPLHAMEAPGGAPGDVGPVVVGPVAFGLFFLRKRRPPGPPLFPDAGPSGPGPPGSGHAQRPRRPPRRHHRLDRRI